MKKELEYFSIRNIKCELTRFFRNEGNLESLRIWTNKEQNITEDFPLLFVQEISSMFDVEWSRDYYNGEDLVLPIINSDNVLHVKSVVRDSVIKRMSAYIEY